MKYTCITVLFRESISLQFWCIHTCLPKRTKMFFGKISTYTYIQAPKCRLQAKVRFPRLWFFTFSRDKVRIQPIIGIYFAKSKKTTFPKLFPTPGDPITTAGNDGTFQSSHNVSTISSLQTISQSALTDAVDAVTGSRVALKKLLSRTSPWHRLFNLITNKIFDPL